MLDPPEVIHARDDGPRSQPEFSQVIAAVERGETIIITKNGSPVARITPQAADRASGPEWRSAFAALEESLRSKPGTGYRVGTITEDDKYGEDA
jgi:prevent-host-death family protein